MTQADESFNRIIFLALEKTLGINLNKAMFAILARDYGITEKNIAENLNKFVSGLERILGPAGTALLVSAVSRVLEDEFGLVEDVSRGKRALSEILEQVRKQLLSDDPGNQNTIP